MSTLLCTSIGTGKDYVLPFWKNMVRKFADVDEVLYVVEEGFTLPKGYFSDKRANETVAHVAVPTIDDAVRPARIAVMRDFQRKAFLDTKHDFLYFHDADMIADEAQDSEQSTVGMLAAYATKHKSHITAHAYMLRAFEYPIFVVMEEEGVNPVGSVWSNAVTCELSHGYWSKCAGVGMGALLLDRKVCEEVAFRTDYAGLDLTWFGEDFAYCVDATAKLKQKPNVYFNRGIWHVGDTGWAGRIVLGEISKQIRTTSQSTIRNLHGTFYPGAWREATPGMERDLQIGFEITHGHKMHIETCPVATLCQDYGV